MLTTPGFDKVAIVSDMPTLAAELSSLFFRPNRYIPVLDGPRMSRDDADNEVNRRTNALIKSGVQHVVLTGLDEPQREAMIESWYPRQCVQSDSFSDIANALKGISKRRKTRLTWGQTNLGVGLYLARLARSELQTTTAPSPTTNFVSAGTHLLVACEEGEELAQVCACNLAFATNASFLVIPSPSKDECDQWLDELYTINGGGNASGRFRAVCNRARSWLPDFPYSQYKRILFITSGFPWGIAVPDCPTTHMYRYPDFGRSIIEGMWASQSPSHSARNALLLDPQQVEGTEIPSIAHSLLKNGTLIRTLNGPAASTHRVCSLLESLPLDIVVISTHAGDAPGERATYEYVDSEERIRRLIIDQVHGFSYNPETDKYLVQEYSRFHELDGVDWTDTAAKAQLYVGTALTSWAAFGGIGERIKYKVHSKEIPRVAGSMALKLHDSLWFFMIHGFSPGAAPFILNNSCSSWHQLSQRFMYAGARCYIGPLFPILDAEAQEIGQTIFGKQLGNELPSGLWAAQNNIYGSQGRRPYAIVGLPFTTVRHNVVHSVSYMTKAYKSAISEYKEKRLSSQHEDVRENALHLELFLREDFDSFIKEFGTP